MKTQEFSLEIDADLTDLAIADALFESGCDDATQFIDAGVSSLHFDRNAETLGDAIASAIRDVRAGLAAAGSPGGVNCIAFDGQTPPTDEEVRVVAEANAWLAGVGVRLPQS